MNLLYSASFASIVACSKDLLQRLSEFIAAYCGSAAAQQFLAACEAQDFNTANQLLNRTVTELTGCTSVLRALDSFAEKFPQLNPELSNQVNSELSESGKVQALDRQYDKIKQLLNRK